MVLGFIFDSEGENMAYRRATYTTKQGEAILAYLKERRGTHIAASQLIEHFENGGANIGRTTVYRQLEKLVSGGEVRKFMFGENEGAVYQYVGECGSCNEHFHMKCLSCGEFYHADRIAAPDAANRAALGSGFEIDFSKTIIYGKCRTCLEKASI
jgi:Fur family ferric uptake transcriptional regulator